MRILAIDPGKDIGFSDSQGDTWQVTWDMPYVSLYHLLWQISPDVLVYETFNHRQRSGVDLTPAELIGVIKLYHETTDCTLVPQTPSYGKSYFDNRKLRYLGLYKPGDDNADAMDALRHRLQYEMRNNLFDLTRLKGLS